MVYKLKVGMIIDYLENNKITTFIVKRVPKDENGKIFVVEKDTNKKRKFYRDVLMNCVRHKDKNKKDSAIKIAIKVLKRENRPIHINDLIDLIYKEGYVVPRGGKTFKNTITTSLNKECSKIKPKIKKVTTAVYAKIDCEKSYEK